MCIEDGILSNALTTSVVTLVFNKGYTEDHGYSRMIAKIPTVAKVFDILLKKNSFLIFFNKLNSE